MILRWMVYAGTIALLLGLAALVLERPMRHRGWPVRWLWAGSLAGSLLLPAAAAATVAVLRQMTFVPSAQSSPTRLTITWMPTA
jgi:hypothetical protein